jgi:LysM repeat protein
MNSGAAKATWHATSNINADGKSNAFDLESNYFATGGAASAPHLIWDPFTGQIAQYFPANSRALALRNYGSYQTNRSGKYNIQIEVVFCTGQTRGGKKYTHISETPCKNLDKIVAWLRSLGIKDTWPGGAPTGWSRDTVSWATYNGSSGHYGHNQVPGNDHVDPGKMPNLFASSPTTPPSTPTTKSYTVKAGDTLAAIARANGTTWEILAELNKIPAPYTLSIGRVIQVPLVGSTTPAPTPVTPPKETTPPVDFDLTVPEPVHNYTKVTRDGCTLNKRTADMLDLAQKLVLGVPVPFDVMQGSYNAGGVSASAGTHDGGGAADLSVINDNLTTTQRNAMLRALREAGFAAWLRTPAEGFVYHIHAIAIGDRELSSGARAQVTDYFNGKNALANHGPDTAPASVGRPLATWGYKYKYATWPGVYTVKAGDTLSSLGRKYGVTWESLAKANGLMDPYTLSIGQRLTVPTEVVTTPPVEPPPVPTPNPDKPNNVAIDPKSVTYKKYTAGGSLGDWINKACVAAGVTPSAAWITGYKTAAARESSSNPNAANCWDSNAKTPAGFKQVNDYGYGFFSNGSRWLNGELTHFQCSRGVVQCIPQTFAAYHAPGTSINIYDPVASIAASINYVRSRYGVAKDGSNLASKVQQFDPTRPPKGY